ncbi:MAG: GNAT family N-acetyltransferase [Candidatus Electrothrix sp. ATG2]|nr:GNAT family N-acetyltransferase [Candidatus Electrothrix sp. ATG2]
MTEIDDCEWIKDRITIKIRLGEIILWRPSYDGIWCNMDIFSLPPFSPITAPIENMGKENVQVAYAYSCPLSPPVRRLTKIGNILCLVESIYKHFYVETKGDFQQYLAGKNKKTISTLQRKSRKIDKSNKQLCTFKVYSSPEEFEEFFKLALPISEKSFQHVLFGRGLPNTQQFKEDVMRKSQKGEVLGYILRVQDKPVAYNFCPVLNGNVVLYDESGYDPDYSKYSPGSVLQFKIIEDLFGREGVDYYDLCTGEGVHKKIFATGYVSCGNIFFCSSTPKYLVILSLKMALILLTESIKKLLKVIGQEERIRACKKFIRKNIIRRSV